MYPKLIVPLQIGLAIDITVPPARSANLARSDGRRRRRGRHGGPSLVPPLRTCCLARSVRLRRVGSAERRVPDRLRRAA